ncbi:MAG TPA: undecaprenyl-diphosphatase UppP [Patescibacteria group bacterium]|nr:undecaprenyl-diphosphatase UppP [Patescibacteria group bacterium]
MNSIIAILFGVVQGVTEFIPVSSSGHLLVLHTLFPSFQVGDAIAFDVALHLGTLVAVISFFWRDCIHYLSGFFSLHPKNTEQHESRRVARFLFLAVIPAGIVGLFFEDFITQYLHSTLVVIMMLFIIACVFFVVEHLYAKRSMHHRIQQMSWIQSLSIGCAQVLALIPGTSRSGITIIAGILFGLRRDEAARFSFLVSIPLIFGAGLKKLADLFIMGIAKEDLPIFIFGVLAAAVSGYLAIAFLMQYLSKKTLKPFAAYRIILACVLVILFYF